MSPEQKQELLKDLDKLLTKLADLKKREPDPRGPCSDRECDLQHPDDQGLYLDVALKKGVPSPRHRRYCLLTGQSSPGSRRPWKRLLSL